MNLQKKLDLRETYRTYQNVIRHASRNIELQLALDAVEKFHERKNRPTHKN